MLLREIKLMKMLDHPNIIKIIEVFRRKQTLSVSDSVPCVSFHGQHRVFACSLIVLVLGFAGPLVSVGISSNTVPLPPQLLDLGCTQYLHVFSCMQYLPASFSHQLPPDSGSDSGILPVARAVRRYIIMECCEGGELFDQLTNQPAGRYDVTIYDVTICALHHTHLIWDLGDERTATAVLIFRPFITTPSGPGG
jgi:serine/threonine protein kinase